MMSADYFPEVEADFSSYETFRLGLKRLGRSDLCVVRTSGRDESRVRAAISSADTSADCFFEVAISAKARLKYGLKIFARQFGQGPCLRFCSTGHVHVNPESGAGLLPRIVPTPHFHRINEFGMVVAYKTDVLLDTIQAKLVEDDANRGLTHFAAEMSLVDPEGNAPSVVISREELALDEGDPLHNATFPS